MKRCKMMLFALLMVVPVLVAAGDRDRHDRDHHDRDDRYDHREDHRRHDSHDYRHYGYSPYSYHRYLDNRLGYHPRGYIQHYRPLYPRAGLSRYMLPQHRSNRVIILTPDYRFLPY